MDDPFDKAALLDLLRRMTAAFERLSPAELARLFGDAPVPRLPRPRALPAPAATTREIGERLHGAESREAARQVLGKLKRAELVELARALEVHAQGRDTVATLRDRIVEATVGARLDAIAIRGGSGGLPTLG